MSKLETTTTTTTALSAFTYALKSDVAKHPYPLRLKLFFNTLKIQGETLEEQASNFLARTQVESTWAQDCLIKFITYNKERIADGELEASSLNTYVTTIKLFYEMNDVHYNWKMIARGLPRGRLIANDRAPTVEEMRKIIEYPSSDRRIKPIVCVMFSSGIRLGAWNFLKVKHLTPIYNPKNPKELIAGKLLVYAGEPEQHTSFVTPEAYQAVQEWMDFRASYGEKITPESWVMRDMWKTTNLTHGARTGLAKYPKKIGLDAIKKIIKQAVTEQNLREPLSKADKKHRRHPWKLSHGFRKAYKTHAEQAGMKPIHVELLMGHNVGISGSYYKPTERQLLEDYTKPEVIKALTINHDNSSELQEQVTELTQKNEEQHYTIVGKLAEKDKEIEEMQSKLKVLEENTKLVLHMIAHEYPDRNLAKIIKRDEKKDVAELEIRGYKTKAAYEDAVKSIRKTGDWNNNKI